MKRSIITSLTLCLLFAAPAFAQKIIYVDADAGGANDGTSWSDAYVNLQDGIRHAAAGDEVWVADGTYYPDQGSGQAEGDRFATFQLKSGVGLYGGFSGDESSRDERNVEAFVAVLSGDIGVPGVHDDNSYQVVNGTNTDATAILDGFTVERGNANGSGTDAVGGGMYNYRCSPRVHNIIFRYNTATDGGGVYNDSSSPTFDNVVFYNNRSTGDGGGMYSVEGRPLVKNSEFNRNMSGNNGGALANVNSNTYASNTIFIHNESEEYAGAIYNYKSRSLIENSVVQDNTSSRGGGGIMNKEDNSWIVSSKIIGNEAVSNGGGIHNDKGKNVIINCTILGNKTTTNSSLFRSGGGGVYSVNGEVWFYNVTIGNNTTKILGGGIVNNYMKDQHPVLVNTIMSGNTSTSSSTTGEMYNYRSRPYVATSLIKGDLPDGVINGGGIINVDPVFVDADGEDNVVGTLDDNVRLQQGSFAIDAGDNGVLDLDDDGDTEDDVPEDQDGNNRIWPGSSGTATVDMGAYEYGAPVYVPTPTLVSAGAGDRQVRVVWQPINDQDVIEFRVFRSKRPGASTEVASVAASAEGYTDTGLTNDTTYYYRLKALDGEGNESGFSNELSATPFGTVYVQFIHNVPDAPAVDFHINDSLYTENLAFAEATPFIQVNALNLELDATETGIGINGSELLKADYELEHDKAYIIVANGLLNSSAEETNLHLIRSEARQQASSNDKVDLAFVHGSPDMPAIDLFVLDDTPAHTRTATLASDLSYGQMTGYVSMNPGAHNIELDVAQTSEGDTQIEVFRPDLSNRVGEAFVFVAQGYVAPSDGQQALQLIGYDAEGNALVPNVATAAEATAEVPAAYALYQNYPNPAMAGTTFRFDLPEPTETSLVIYDLLGRAVATVVAEKLPAGVHRHEWQGADLSSGVYLYRLRAGSFSAVKQLVLVR